MKEYVQDVASTCAHCDLSLEVDVVEQDGHQFCCFACMFAYKNILACGLEDYYKIRDEVLKSNKNSALFKAQDFNYLDDLTIRQEYEQAEQEIEFWVEGVQCAACVWLLERLVSHIAGVNYIRVNASQNTIILRYEKEISLNKVLNQLAGFGYILRPIKNAEDKNKWLEEKRSKDLRRLSVAAVCAGNIMLLSFADYFGAEEHFANVFRWVSMLLTLPILFYSAFPILKNTFLSLKKGFVSLDLPISLAFSAGFILSLYSLFVSSSKVYFDTISILIFLVLLSRYFIKRVQERFYQHLNFYDSLVPMVTKTSKDTYKLVKNLVTGESIFLEEGMVIPVDAYILEGQAWVNESILNGEASTRYVSQGAKVFAGSKMVKGNLSLCVEQTYKNSRIGKILTQASQNILYKENKGSFEERWATYFTLVSFVLGLSCFIVYRGEWLLAFERCLSVFIVSCPCAIAFGSPLIQSKSLDWLNKKGIFIKQAKTLSEVESIKNIFFDKTGTLTKGDFKIDKIEIEEKEIINVIALQRCSQHPVARAILNYYSKVNINKEVEGFSIIPTKGVSGYINGIKYSALSKANDGNDLCIEFFRDAIKIGEVQLMDSIRVDMLALITGLKRSFNISILSGDKYSLVKHVADRLGVKNYLASLNPEDKESNIRSATNTMMVGDGINDTAAIASANIGIIVGGSIEKALGLADVFIASDDLKYLDQLWLAASYNKRAHIYIFIFSMIYNLLTAGLAFWGLITPIMAAILMPLSTLSILCIVLISFKGGRWKSYI